MCTWSVDGGYGRDGEEMRWRGRGDRGEIRRDRVLARPFHFSFALVTPQRN